MRRTGYWTKVESKRSRRDREEGSRQTTRRHADNGELNGGSQAEDKRSGPSGFSATSVGPMHRSRRQWSVQPTDTSHHFTTVERQVLRGVRSAAALICPICNMGCRGVSMPSSLFSCLFILLCSSQWNKHRYLTTRIKQEFQRFFSYFELNEVVKIVSFQIYSNLDHWKTFRHL